MSDGLSTIIPRALQNGDTIAFVSPSARLNDIMPTPIARGKEYLESLGFEVQIIFTGLPPGSSIAESIRVRCEELHMAFRNIKIAAIICTIGGSHANELLPFLDYSLIRSNPKIFVGYSDASFLHYGIHSRTGLRTFYGPSILSDFADFPKPIQFTVDHFLHVLTRSGDSVGPLPRSGACSVEHNDFFFGTETSRESRELTESPPWLWLRKGHATGNLYGGTISCVVRLQGTSFAPRSWKGKILFLESAMGDNMGLPYTVNQFRNNLVDLALAGILQDISGLVIGRGYKYDVNMQKELAKVISEVLEVIAFKNTPPDKELPILMNVDFGHTSPFLTLPFGALASLDSDSNEFVVHEPGVHA